MCCSEHPSLTARIVRRRARRRRDVCPAVPLHPFALAGMRCRRHSGHDATRRQAQRPAAGGLAPKSRARRRGGAAAWLPAQAALSAALRGVRAPAPAPSGPPRTESARPWSGAHAPEGRLVRRPSTRTRPALPAVHAQHVQQRPPPRGQDGAGQRQRPPPAGTVPPAARGRSSTASAPGPPQQRCSRAGTHSRHTGNRAPTPSTEHPHTPQARQIGAARGRAANSPPHCEILHNSGRGHHRPVQVPSAGRRADTTG